MGYFRYSKYEFVIPPPINEFVYFQIKYQLDKNKDYEYYRWQNSIIKSFLWHYKPVFIGLFIGYFFLYFSNFSNIEWLNGFLLIGGIFLFVGLGMFGGLRTLLEAYSFIIFLMERRDYYQYLISGVKQSENYEDFYKTFYSRPNNRLVLH